MAEWKKVVLDGAAASLASLTLTTDLAILHGGTGASDASTARTNLGAQAAGDVLDDLNTLGAASANGEFIVATGAGAFAYESGATARTSLGLGDAAEATKGIADGNVLASDGSIVDDDFLRVNGTSIEGRSASEMLSDIGAASAGANSDITSITGLTTALSAGIGGTGLLQAALTSGTAGQVLALNSTKDAFELADASSGDITGITTAANSGLDGGATSGAPSLSLDVNNLTAATIDVAADFIAFSDEGTAGDPTRKESVADLVSAVAGTVTSTGLAASSGVLSVDIANLTNLGGTTIDQADEFILSDAGALKALTFSNLEDTIFANITSAGGDVTAAAGGALTIAANSVQGGTGGGMLNDDIISAQDTIADDAAGGDFVLISDTSTSRIKKISVTNLIASAPQGDITEVAAGTGLNGGATSGVATLNLDTSLSTVTAMTNVNTINASGNALALGSSDSNVTVQGNLIVNGTASFEDAETLRIKDPMIILRSGSAGAGDGGFIVEQSGGETGQFFGYDASAGSSGGRFGLVASVAEDATSVTISNFMPTVTQGALGGAPAGAPLYGGTTGYGNFAVDTTNHDLYVYISS